MKKTKFYNLSNDHLFKEVFRKEENIKILLQDFFGIEAVKIVYKNGETLKKNKTDKYGVIDILIKINDNINCIMEMQNYSEKGFKERLLKYACTITSDEGLKESKDYIKLKKTLVLALVNFNKKQYKDYIEALLKEKDNKIFSNKLEFKIINLKNYKKNNALYKMLTCKSLEEIKIYKNDSKYKEIYEMIKYYNLDEEERCKMDRVAQLLEEEKFGANEIYKIGKSEGYIAGEIAGKSSGIKIGEINGIKIGESNGIKTGETRKSLRLLKTYLIIK